MSMKSIDEGRQAGRREFLRNVLVGSSAAAVAIASGGAQAAPAPKPAATPKAPSQGYHVTQHILDYYKSTQF
jgi:hypothetical protein